MLIEKKKEIFFCYAREDEELRIALEKQLNILQRQGFISIWHDRKISAGKEWEQEIDVHLNTAHFILLLISPDFMVSEYCYGKEMKRAMERHEAREARVIPVILRPVYWQRAPFGKLQALPSDGKPVVSSHWHSQDEAFYNVAEGIRKAVEELNTSLVANVPTTPLVGNFSEKSQPALYDVSLDYYAADARWVEHLAQRLRDEQGLRVLLNRWISLSELSWQPDKAESTDQANCGIVCLGEQTPIAWFKQQLQRLLERHNKEPSFRVMPVLFPGAKTVNIPHLPTSRIWVDFRSDNQDYAFHVLVCGIKGIPPGRWPSRKAQGTGGS